MLESKLSIVLKELELVQIQLNKYDDLSDKIRTWAITLWIASLGWYFQVHNKNIVILNIVAVLALWFLNAVNKNFREDYRNRREDVVNGLEVFFKSNIWPDGFSSPKTPRHQTKKVLRYFFVLHIFLNYLPLIIISFLIYFLI